MIVKQRDRCQQIKSFMAPIFVKPPNHCDRVAKLGQSAHIQLCTAEQLCVKEVSVPIVNAAGATAVNAAEAPVVYVLNHPASTGIG